MGEWLLFLGKLSLDVGILDINEESWRRNKQINNQPNQRSDAIDFT